MVNFNSSDLMPVDEYVSSTIAETATKLSSSSAGDFAGIYSILTKEACNIISRSMNIEPYCLFFASSFYSAFPSIIKFCVEETAVKNIISFKAIGAISTVIKNYCDDFQLKYSIIESTDKGDINLTHLESILQISEKSLIILPHACKFTGVLFQIKNIVSLCRKYDGIITCDNSMTIYSLPFSQINTDIDILMFHAGHLYTPFKSYSISISEKIISKSIHYIKEKYFPFIPEPVELYSTAKAFQNCINNRESWSDKLSILKNYFVNKLDKTEIGFEFNNTPKRNSLNSILSITIDKIRNAEIEALIAKFNLNGFNIFLGQKPLYTDPEIVETFIRISFSKFNDLREIDSFIRFLRFEL